MNRKNTILIVDDDKAIVKVVTLILTGAGFEVIADTTGELDFLHSINFPDLILLDNQLGDKSGATICRSLKSNEVTHSIPVMMISATEGIEEIAKKADADDFLAKPFDMHTLLEKIAALLPAA